ncbi:benzoylformate decarboxylase [Streptomyces turgidiscabies]|uniref:benzoylformate decarboxylase n=2 Tax=Streptomyces TaxID=1883 RepID=UPI0005C83AFF|nr:benzoylformate decarboxylase [Streptomyces turgidiscabies]MDX3499690.1 benzoylformate decarboxylase [Streptomyces turgidiscabies]GAQ73364.1 benzoylformate decarboxylase [Streptomyces turgidiscabies]
MPTVRETTYDLLRAWGLTTVFGNPGSNELPFLDGFPPDFRYVLGLHEGAVVAMADGYAQATGRPALVNLHSAAGLGNAMGVLANARASHTPLVLTAGQQTRAMVGLGSVLAEPAMTRVPEPQVKWAFEPARAQDVPRALSEAFHLSVLPPAGPVFVSLPMDDWAEEVAAHEVAHLPGRRVRWAGAAGPELIAELTDRLRQAASPALVIGPEADDERVATLVVELAEQLRAPVWTAPTPPRCPFPTRHPLWQGVLPPGIAGVSEHLQGHDLVLVVGAPVFRYHAYRPGPWLPEGTELIALSGDPGSAARAAFGDAVVCDVAEVVRQLLERLPPPARTWPPSRELLSVPQSEEAPFTADWLFAQMALRMPADVRLVNESTSNTAQFWAHLNLDRPRSLFFPAAGALGFGLPAAVGVALADPERPVVAVLGDGAVQYGVAGLWTAAQWNLPVTFLVLRNGGYGALRGFVGQLGITGAPGLDLPGLDAVSIALGYGIPAQRLTEAEEVAAALAATTAASGPRLLEIPVCAETRPLG